MTDQTKMLLLAAAALYFLSQRQGAIQGGAAYRAPAYPAGYGGLPQGAYAPPSAYYGRNQYGTGAVAAAPYLIDSIGRLFSSGPNNGMPVNYTGNAAGGMSPQGFPSPGGYY